MADLIKSGKSDIQNETFPPEVLTLCHSLAVVKAGKIQARRSNSMLVNITQDHDETAINNQSWFHTWKWTETLLPQYECVYPKSCTEKYHIHFFQMMLFIYSC